MEKQNPEFEIPEAISKLSEGEVSLLIPPDESEKALIYSSLQKRFHEERQNRHVPAPRAPRNQPSRKRPRAQRKSLK